MAYTRAQCQQALAVVANGFAQCVLDVSKIAKRSWVDHEPAVVEMGQNVVIDHPSGRATVAVPGPSTAIASSPNVGALISSPSYAAAVRDALASVTALQVDGNLLATYATFTTELGAAQTELTEDVVSEASRFLDGTNPGYGRGVKKAFAVYTRGETSLRAVEQFSCWDVSKAGQQATAKAFLSGEMTYRGMLIVPASSVTATGNPATVKNVAFLEKRTFFGKSVRSALVDDETHVEMYSETTNDLGSNIGAKLSINPANSSIAVQIALAASVLAGAGVRVLS